MGTYYQGGDRIVGDIIIMEARDIDKKRNPVARSGRHQAQHAVGRRDAEAWIDRAMKSVRDLDSKGDKAK